MDPVGIEIQGNHTSHAPGAASGKKDLAAGFRPGRGRAGHVGLPAIIPNLPLNRIVSQPAVADGL